MDPTKIQILRKALSLFRRLPTSPASNRQYFEVYILAIHIGVAVYMNRSYTKSPSKTYQWEQAPEKILCWYVQSIKQPKYLPFIQTFQTTIALLQNSRYQYYCNQLKLWINNRRGSSSQLLTNSIPKISLWVKWRYTGIFNLSTSKSSARTWQLEASGMLIATEYTLNNTQ